MPEFWCSNISAVTEHTRNQIFFCELSKFFFLQMFNLVLSEGFLDDFSKFWLFIFEICILIWYFWVISKIIMRMLSIRGNNFIAHWVYAETILSHTEHMRKRFHRTLSVHRTNFSVCSVNIIRKYAEHTRNVFHRRLSMRGTNFIAGWACGERISLLAGNDSNTGWAYPEMLKSWISPPNQILFSKISSYRPLGPEGFGFCKKSIKKCHACVPLTYV